MITYLNRHQLNFEIFEPNFYISSLIVYGRRYDISANYYTGQFVHAHVRHRRTAHMHGGDRIICMLAIHNRMERKIKLVNYCES